MQEQSSSPYIPFALEDYTEEVISTERSITVLTLSENAKSQLQALIPLLETDTSVLVQDAGAVRDIFNSIKDELPPQLKEVLKLAAFIECYEPKFSGAQTRLASREAQRNQPTREKQCVQNMLEVKELIDRLNNSPAKIHQKLATLNAEREQLLIKLKDIEAAIKHEEGNLARIPTTLSEQKRLMSFFKSELQGIKTEKKTPIPGTAEEDKQQIADVDSIRLNALDMIKSMLSM